MLSKKFQRKVFETCKNDPDAVVWNGNFDYQIAYNPMCAIHTWIIRRVRYGGDGKWHWLQPLDSDIN